MQKKSVLSILVFRKSCTHICSEELGLVERIKMEFNLNLYPECWNILQLKRFEYTHLHRLKCGKRSWKTVETVLNATNETLRMINKLCRHSLMIGASQNQDIIDADTVRKAILDNQLG